MAVTYFTGFESGAAGLDGITLTGTAAYSTVQARTGTSSIRCNPASSATGYVTVPSGTYVHFALYVPSLNPPTASWMVFGSNGVGIQVRLSPTGAGGYTTFVLQALNDATLLGSGFSGITVGAWHWIGVRTTTGTSTPFLSVDGVADTNSTETVTGTVYRMGRSTTTPQALDMYVDDVIIDNAGFIAASNVAELVPTADSAIGTGWTLGSGGTSNLYDALNNQPPTAVADAGTTAQIRNAANSANSNYDATLQTYTVGGVGASDTILAIQNVIATAAPVTTSSKQGTVGNVSNPAITNIALGAGGTAGAFWSGVAGGTYPTGWKVSTGTLTTSPSVTKGTAPVMRVTQVTSSTRIAMVAYMALRVAWTPVESVEEAPATGNRQTPQLLAQ